MPPGYMHLDAYKECHHVFMQTILSISPLPAPLPTSVPTSIVSYGGKGAGSGSLGGSPGSACSSLSDPSESVSSAVQRTPARLLGAGPGLENSSFPPFSLTCLSHWKEGEGSCRGSQWTVVALPLPGQVSAASWLPPACPGIA